jgi:chromosomal replication initiation ATPase DnaA
MTTQKVRLPRISLLTHKRVNIEEEVYSDVIELVAKEFNTPASKILCKKRNFELVMARNMACYILHVVYKQKASQIAPYFKRDRTTILYAVNNFPNDLKQIPFLMERYESVLNTIHNYSKIYALDQP